MKIKYYIIFIIIISNITNKFKITNLVCFFWYYFLFLKMEPSAKRRALRLSTIQLQELSEAIGPEKTQKEPSPRVDLKVAPVTRKRKTTVSTPSINIARTQSSKLLNKHWTESQVQELKKKTNSSADHKPLPNYPLCMSHNTLFTPTIENSPSVS